MNHLTLVLRSLLFHRRAHAGVLLGTAVSTTVLVGALLVGDSVRHSLKRLALTRLGRTELALSSGTRVFRAALADDLAESLGAETAPVLQLSGFALGKNGTMRANGVRALGIDRRFWSIGGAIPALPEIHAEEAMVNQRLAAILDLKPGDEFLLRVGKIDLLPREAALSLETDSTIALRLTVKDIVSDEQFGRFSLRSNQVGPLNVFLSLPWLANEIELPGRANMMLVAGRTGPAISHETADRALRKVWQLADASLELRELNGQEVIELRSERVFLGPQTERAVLRVEPDAESIMTYFVNRIGSGNRVTPYSFVSAPGEPLVPSDMADNEIIINEWTADDLGIGAGGSIELTYYVFGPMRGLMEETASFRVMSVVPISGLAADRDLMPMFPGMAEAGSCSEWDPGIPIDLDSIREKDENYWDMYRGTPKAFVTLPAARRMWKNRYGSLTAIRFPGGEGVLERVNDEILNALKPSELGLSFRPVRLDALLAGKGSVDFGQLFLGLSFFLIIAAMLLTGLLFIFGIEARAEEAGTLMALGWQQAHVRRLFLFEGLIPAVFGGLLGSLCGVLYNHAVLHGLSTVWSGAVGATVLLPHLRPLTVAIGALLGIGTAVPAMWLAARRQSTVSVRQLQMQEPASDAGQVRRKMRACLLVSAACAMGVMTIAVSVTPAGGKEVSGAFFGAGALLLCGFLALLNAVLLKAGAASNSRGLSITRLGFRNCARRRGRSLAVSGILACGVFIIVAVGANRHDASEDSGNRRSGTGGFAFFGETSIPVLHDLNSDEGRRRFGLNEGGLEDTHFVQIRVLEGDDASCLNLNKVENPRVLGVDPEEFAKRGAFTFAKIADGVDPENPWSALSSQAEPRHWRGKREVYPAFSRAVPLQPHAAAPLSAPISNMPRNDTIPAIADQNVITWGLGKSIGDILEYVDESGRTFKLKLIGGLANSIFQGSILISDEALAERFPSISGTRIFLVDAPSGDRRQISGILSKSMRDLGLDLVPAADRLAAFNVVENTYLMIFLALGGLGLILGTVGIGVVILRNVLERRAEMALLRAVGFSRSDLYWLVLSEHGVLLAVGLVCGVLSALIAVLPALSSSGMLVPLGSVAVLLAAVTAGGLIWTVLATIFSVRGCPISSLRSE